jgi:hypothetical protein
MDTMVNASGVQSAGIGAGCTTLNNQSFVEEVIIKNVTGIAVGETGIGGSQVDNLMITNSTLSVIGFSGAGLDALVGTVIFQGTVFLWLSGSETVPAISASSIELGDSAVTAMTRGSALFSGAIASSDAFLSIYYTNQTIDRERIDGISFLQFGLVDIPPTQWQLSVSRANATFKIEFDRIAFSSLLISVPMSGDYTVSGTSEFCEVTLRSPNGSFLFHTDPGEEFFTTATGGPCFTSSTSIESEPVTLPESNPATPIQSKPITPIQSKPATLTPSNPATPTQSKPITPTRSEPATLTPLNPATPTQSRPATQVTTIPTMSTSQTEEGLPFVGLIVNITISGVALVFVIIATVFFCRRKVNSNYSGLDSRESSTNYFPQSWDVV